MTGPRLQPERAQACSCPNTVTDEDGACLWCSKYPSETISSTFREIGTDPDKLKRRRKGARPRRRNAAQ